jgi:dephospho-CoA kinase
MRELFWKMGQARHIGLTGGIATGKSTVARLLSKRHGIPVLDADCFAREALAPGSEATQAVFRRYGAAVRAGQSSDDGLSLDRAALARIVFADSGERRWLEQLVHPMVRDRFAAGLQALAGAPVVVLMIPLLFEAALEPLCSEIWVVDCGSEEEQLRRLQARDGIPTPEALARLKAQWPMAAKLVRADVVIHNCGLEANLIAQVDGALATRPPAGRGGWLSD